MKNKTTTTTVSKPKKELRPVLKAKKAECEKLGWEFKQGADEMWSATKDIGNGYTKYFGEHRYLSALITQIEGDETGIHQPGKYGGESENYG